ncbi:MAG: ribosome silencing factor [Candidatus Methylacidiphilales bacterium]
MSIDKKPAKKVAAKKVAKKVAAKKVSSKAATAKKETTKTNKITDPTEFLAWAVAQGMFERKAQDIKILDMRNVRGASSDFFVISNADSDKQVEAIAHSVDEEVKKLTGETPWHREGLENNEWVLLDYFNVVAHIFQTEKREFYAVEELWGDALNVEFVGK